MPMRIQLTARLHHTNSPTPFFRLLEFFFLIGKKLTNWRWWWLFGHRRSQGGSATLRPGRYRAQPELNFHFSGVCDLSYFPPFGNGFIFSAIPDVEFLKLFLTVFYNHLLIKSYICGAHIGIQRPGPSKYPDFSWRSCTSSAHLFWHRG